MACDSAFKWFLRRFLSFSFLKPAFLKKGLILSRCKQKAQDREKLLSSLAVFFLQWDSIAHRGLYHLVDEFIGFLASEAQRGLTSPAPTISVI